MGREGYSELTESIKKQFNVDTVYSYSQVKTFLDDPYEYYLRYVKHEQPDILEDSPYGLCGNVVHNILEQFQQGLITRDTGIASFYEDFKEVMTKPATKPFSTIPSLNITMATNFQLNMVDYLKRMQKVEGQTKCEEPIVCYLKNGTARAAFAGYIDFVKFHKDGRITVIDYKTSTLYDDKDIPTYANQLYLYALAIKQKYQKSCEDITVGWNFLKYVKLVNKNDLSEEIVERSKLNNFGDLSEYTIEDCIITVDFTEKTEAQFVDNLLNTISTIEEAYVQSNNGVNDSPYMFTVTRNDLFRLESFCKYSPKLHKPWSVYLQNKN